MNQEPCGSETRWLPVPVTERLVLDQGTSAEQAVHTPNDEERLEQMVHPKNQSDGTEDAPRKVEWTCLGLHAFGYGKGRMDLLGSVWNGYGKVLLVVEEKGVLGPQCSPKHNAFDSSLSVWV